MSYTDELFSLLLHSNSIRNLFNNCFISMSQNNLDIEILNLNQNVSQSMLKSIEYIKIQELSFLPEYYFITVLFCFTLFFLFSFEWKSDNYYFKYNSQLVFLLIFSLACYLMILSQQIDVVKISSISFNDTIINDQLSLTAKTIIGFSSMLYLIIIPQYLKNQKLNNFEYYIIVLTALFGFFLLCNANDLITAYLAIELQGLSFYVLASFKKSSNFSVESGVKYFILGSLSTALFLFGTTFIYGLSGSVLLTDFKDFFIWVFSINSFFLSFDSIFKALEIFQEKTFVTEDPSVTKLQIISNKIELFKKKFYLLPSDVLKVIPDENVNSTSFEKNNLYHTISIEMITLSKSINYDACSYFVDRNYFYMYSKDYQAEVLKILTLQNFFMENLFKDIYVWILLNFTDQDTVSKLKEITLGNFDFELITCTYNESKTVGDFYNLLMNKFPCTNFKLNDYFLASKFFSNFFFKYIEILNCIYLENPELINKTSIEHTLPKNILKDSIQYFVSFVDLWLNQLNVDPKEFSYVIKNFSFELNPAKVDSAFVLTQTLLTDNTFSLFNDCTNSLLSPYVGKLIQLIPNVEVTDNKEMLTRFLNLKSFNSTFSIINILSLSNLFLELFEINSWDHYFMFDLSIVILGFLLITLALFFKLALAPFHLWAPDVYEGSPSSSTFYFMIVSKFSSFVFLLRLFYISFYSLITYWQFYSLLVATISIFIGAIVGLKQRRLKSLLTYSSINNTGFVLLALSVGTLEGIQTQFYYLIIYIISGLCVWAIILNLKLKKKVYMNKQNRDLGDLTLLQESNNIIAQSLALTLFTLAGLPPMVGFLAKMGVFKSLIGVSFYFFSFINITFSVIATFYYLRIIKIIFFENILIGKLYENIHNKNITFLINILTLLLIFLFLSPVLSYFYSYKITLFLNKAFY